MFEFLATVQFPDGPAGFMGIPGAVFSVVGWLYNGIGSYGVAIILFTLLLRLVLIPLDFGTKYFTKKNAIRMAEIKPEEEALKEAHADDPLALQRARSALYKKHGAGMGGFCLFTILNLALTMMIFFSVFSALNGISNYNVNQQFIRLQAVHAHHYTYNSGDLSGGGYAPLLDSDGDFVYEDDNGTPVRVYISFRDAINAEYNATRTGFLWVHNIWRPDTWAQRTLSWSQFRNAVDGVQGSVLLYDSDGYRIDSADRAAHRAELQVIYNQIFNATYGIDQTGRGWNGMLFLILLAAATTYVSMIINAKTMQKTKATKENAKKEVEVGYSIRRVKNQSADGQQAEKLPSIDPASATKIMKFIMPVVMIGFTIGATAALAIYIIAGAVFMTGISLLNNFLVEKLIKHQENKKKLRDAVEGGDDTVVTINPHAKYFRRSGKKKS